MKSSLLCILVPFAVLSRLHGAALVSGTLSDYVALGATGGTIGETRFSNFTILPDQTGATRLSPNDISVNPVNVPGMPGLQFVVNDSATGSDLFGLRFSYRISDTPLFAATLSIADSAASGESAVTVVEDLNFTNQPNEMLAVFRTASDSELVDQVSFPSTPSAVVTMDITLDGGGNGLASLGSTTSQVAVPEPGALGLFATAAGVLGLRRRR